MELIILLVSMTGIPIFMMIWDLLLIVTGNKRIRFLVQFTGLLIVLIYPVVFLGVFDIEEVNNCCSDSAVFSPDHRLTIYVLIILILASFLYSLFRKTIASPIVEVLVNVLLLIGVFLNAAVTVHVDAFLNVFSVMIIYQLTLMLYLNQQKLMERLSDFDTSSTINAFAVKILMAKPLIKFPILIILCLPIIVILTSILMLFGQKPDSIIQAFTQTYKHGLSEIDYMCDNVECGGHYLCSVAAKGHPSIVKPSRLGMRNGNLILCNRQLLVSNAFENLLEEKLPKTHRFIRENYNKIGNKIHKYYYVFENKYFADIIYVLMKPLEWFFVFTLYLFDTKPENRISRQYL